MKVLLPSNKTHPKSINIIGVLMMGIRRSRNNQKKYKKMKTLLTMLDNQRFCYNIQGV